MALYYTVFGSDPQPIVAAVLMSGPQDESQIPEPVKQLLDKKGVTSVAVMFNHGQGNRVETFRRMIKADDK